MATASRALLLPACLLAAVMAAAGCTSGKRDSREAAFRPPQPGTVVGNWVVASERLLDGTVEPGLVGTAVRVAPGWVEAVAASYMGPGTLLWDFFDVTGVATSRTQRVERDQFTLQIVLDYSFLQGRSAGWTFSQIDVAGGLVDGFLQVDFLDRFFETDKQGRPVEVEEERYRFELICRPGREVPLVEGWWEVADITVLEDTGAPHEIHEGDRMLAGPRRVRELFGMEVSPGGVLGAVGPTFTVTHLDSFVGRGVATLLARADGLPGTGFADQSFLLFCEFLHTGEHLLGEYLRFLDDGKEEDMDWLWLRLVPLAGPPSLTMVPRPPGQPPAGGLLPRALQRLP